MSVREATLEQTIDLSRRLSLPERLRLLSILSEELSYQIVAGSSLNITSFAARQKAGGLALSKVGTGIGADEPSLVATNQRVVWRVPLFLALPSLGRLGQVGEIDVDAQTGEVLADGATFARIIARADRLAPDSTP